MKLVEEEHNEIIKIIDETTYEKYEKLRATYQKTNIAQLQLDRHEERVKLKSSVNQITCDKILEILNENNIETNRFIL